MKRLREKYEAELRELQRSETSAVEKQQELRKQQVEAETELIRLQAALRQKEQENEDVTQVSHHLALVSRLLWFGKANIQLTLFELQARDKLMEERRSLAEVIRQEFADRLVLTEEENRRMRVEVSEVRARLRLEVERVGREKEEELAEVHQR